MREWRSLEETVCRAMVFFSQGDQGDQHGDKRSWKDAQPTVYVDLEGW